MSDDDDIILHLHNNTIIYDIVFINMDIPGMYLCMYADRREEEGVMSGRQLAGVRRGGDARLT